MLKTIKPVLPPATDIYDFDTQQLHQTLHTVKSAIQSCPNTEQSSPEDQEWMEKATYIRQLIETEIEQRKQVQSFGNMCMNYKPEDNPFDFLKRFDDFNRQLQKLVQEAQKAKIVPPSVPDKTQKSTTLPPIDKHQTTSSTVTQQSQKYQDLGKSTHSHFTAESSEKSVKMGIGNKKRKSEANDMMSLLDKLRVNKDNKVTIGKSTQIKKVEGPKQVHAEHKQTRTSQIKQQNRNSKQEKPARTSQSKIVPSAKSQQLEKKKEEALKTMQKTAVTSKSHKKQAKIPTNKDLIAMVRQQQQQKKNKIVKGYESIQSAISQQENLTVQHHSFEPRSLKQLNVPNNATQTPKSQTQQIIIEEKISTNSLQSQSNASSESQIKEKIVGINENKITQHIPIKQEEFEESIQKIPQKQIQQSKQPTKIQVKPQTKQLIIQKKTNEANDKLQPSNRASQPKAVVNKSLEVVSQKRSNSGSQKQSQKVEPSTDQIVQDIREQQDNDEPEHRKFQLKGRLIRTSTASSQKSNRNTKGEHVRAESAVTHKLIDKNTFSKIEKRVENEYTDDLELHFQPNSAQQTSSQQTKDCYSEDYWIKVKRQAMQNLEKLQKERENRQLQKIIVNDQVNKALAEMQEYKQKAAEILGKQQESQTTDKTDQAEEQDSPTQLPVITKPEETKKTAKPIRKKAPKKQEKPIAIPAKSLPAHIQNYLDIFPTFNHIFSVYYLKPSAQAILDINVIMKEIYTVFAIHKQVMQSNNYRKPLFTPFDNYNTVYINQPRQLLMHAQTTNIDIKTMIARLSVFNENLHGRFDEDSNTMHYRVVKNREEVYDIITTTFLRLKGWRELPHGMNLRTSWNLFWTWAKPELDFNKLLAFQKINHFPLNKNISRKDLLYKNIQMLRRQFRVPINFLPLTFNLPKEYSQFSAKFHEDQMFEQQNNIWIMKPIGKSRGRGIKLINNIIDVTCTDNIVVQKYLKNPLLLDGYKFDMRIYVLVTSVHPLEAFVYRQGFARLSTEKYVLDADSIKNTFIHLTNFAIQKNNREAAVQFEGGSKISLKVLQQKLTKMGVNWSIIWDKVHDIIVKSLLACSMSMPKFPCAFELFGYDVMIDDNLNCYLIEVNSSPSLERSYMIDELIKQSLIDDIIELIDPPNFDRQECCEVFTERLARKGMPTTPKEDNIDIARILRFKPIRKVGEMPEKMGLFERVAPEKRSQELEKMVEAKFNPNIRYLDN